MDDCGNIMSVHNVKVTPGFYIIHATQMHAIKSLYLLKIYLVTAFRKCLCSFKSLMKVNTTDRQLLCLS